MDGVREPREFRFGTSDPPYYSQYWVLKATRAVRELVIVPSRLGRSVHWTLHEDRTYSHLRVVLEQEVIERPWVEAEEVLPGVRRLVRILTPLHAVRYPEPHGSAKVAWYPRMAGTDRWTQHTVLYCERGVPAIKGTDLIGRLDLANAAVLVIAQEVMAEPFQATFSVSDAAKAEALKGRRDIGMIVHGLDTDRCVWLLQLDSSEREPLRGDEGS